MICAYIVCFTLLILFGTAALLQLIMVWRYGFRHQENDPFPWLIHQVSATRLGISVFLTAGLVTWSFLNPIDRAWGGITVLETYLITCAVTDIWLEVFPLEYVFLGIGVGFFSGPSEWLGYRIISALIAGSFGFGVRYIVGNLMRIDKPKGQYPFAMGDCLFLGVLGWIVYLEGALYAFAFGLILSGLILIIIRVTMFYKTEKLTAYPLIPFFVVGAWIFIRIVTPWM